MDIDRFLAKPVEVEVRGEKVMIKPLTTEFYPLITKLMYYDQKFLVAKSKLKEGEVVEIDKVFTAEEFEKRAEIELEIAYLTFESNFEGITREKFKDFNKDVIQEIMVGAMKANGLTDENIGDIKKVLMGNDKQNKG